MDITKTIMELRKIDVEGNKTWIEMRGMKEEESGCKKSVEMLHLINV